MHCNLYHFNYIEFFEILYKFKYEYLICTTLKCIPLGKIFEIKKKRTSPKENQKTTKIHKTPLKSSLKKIAKL